STDETYSQTSTRARRASHVQVSVNPCTSLRQASAHTLLPFVSRFAVSSLDRRCSTRLPGRSNALEPRAPAFAIDDVEHRALSVCEVGSERVPLAIRRDVDEFPAQARPAPQRILENRAHRT